MKRNQWAALLVLLLISAEAHAVPSFARQTGLPCAQCHTMAFGPTLNSFGRQFKLNGYVLGDAQNSLPPIALMVLGGFSHTAADQPQPPVEHYKANDNLSIDQVSVFYGGRIAGGVGALLQATYSGEQHRTHWDNTDIRRSTSLTVDGTALVVGVSVNNNPTVQDLWNSTQAWGFPYVTSPLLPLPSATPLINTLGQLVLGATGYAMVGEHLYLEGGAYRGLSDHWLGNVGVDAATSPHLDGIAPYWRMALQWERSEQYFSAGLFDLGASLKPDPAQPSSDRYEDFGADLTHQYFGLRHGVTTYLTYVHERRHLDASFAQGPSDAPANWIDTLQFSTTYTYRQTWSGSLGLFETSGSTNTGLFVPAQLSGSANSRPRSSGYLLQAEWVPFGKPDSLAHPWLNLRAGLQYTGYWRFNGGTSNYDGFGRSARDNDAWFAFLWIAI